jgi:hypothetical protein
MIVCGSYLQAIAAGAVDMVLPSAAQLQMFDTTDHTRAMALAVQTPYF